MNRENAYIEIAAVEGVALLLAHATTFETKLADERALVKDEGIARLRSSGVASSVTAAEKVIELDAAYMSHRELERKAVAARIVAQGKYEAAKLRARLAVELVAIDEPARDPDYEIIERDSAEENLERQLERIDDLLDKAGIIEKGADGMMLGVAERVRIMVDEVYARESA